jgi:hypothetical protein
MDTFGTVQRKVLADRVLTDRLSFPKRRSLGRPHLNRKKPAYPVGGSVGDSITSQLLPFRKAMTANLKRRGFNTSHLELKTVIPLYYNEILNAQPNSPYQPVNVSDFVNSSAFKVKKSDHESFYEIDFRVNEKVTEVTDVVNDIIENFKLSLAKKNVLISQGIEPKSIMNDIEYYQAKATEKVIHNLETKQLDEATVKVSGLHDFILIVFSLMILYYLTQ